MAPVQPGGGVDLVGGNVAEQLGKSLGQSFIVENVSGGGGSIASQVVARAAPDGYTLMVATSPRMARAPRGAIATSKGSSTRWPIP